MLPFEPTSLALTEHNLPVQSTTNRTTHSVAPAPSSPLDLPGMAPESNFKSWRNQPLATPNAFSVHEHHGFNPTDEAPRDNKHGANVGDIEVVDEMTSFFRSIFDKYCDKPGQPVCQGSARQNDNMDGNQDSDSDIDQDQLDGDAILTELIKLTLAQQRMILSLHDVNKETNVQLRITNARLDLVEEELSIMRSSLADQATPSLFSGVRMSSSFGGTERDTAGDYIPKFDLTDIGATLATGPGPGSEFGHPGYHTRDGSPSPRSSIQCRRSLRPERYALQSRLGWPGAPSRQQS